MMLSIEGLIDIYLPPILHLAELKEERVRIDRKGVVRTE